MRRSILCVLGLCVLLALPGALLAQVFGSDYVDSGGFRFSVAITGWSENGIKISGTKVDFGVTATALPLPGEPDPNTWDGFRIASGTLRFQGGGIDETRSLTGLPPAPNLSPYSKSARIASTHFPHGTTLDITLTVVFEGLKLINGELVPMQSVPVDVTVSPSVYNVALIWADYYSEILVYARWTAKEAKNAVTGDIEPWHFFDYATDPEFRGVENVVLDSMKEATFMHASAHGASTHVCDSLKKDWGPPLGPQGILTWPEIEAAVMGDRLVPLPNLVIHYVCQSLTTASASSHQVLQSNGSIIAGKAMAGFKTDVFAGAASPTNEHANILYSALLSGSTLAAAVVEANDENLLIQSDNNETEAEMEIEGDPQSRLVGVYRGDLGSILLGAKEWFVLF